jgi:hypothetical protein
MKIANKFFENVARFKHMGMMLTDQNCMHEEMKIRMSVGLLMAP